MTTAMHDPFAGHTLAKPVPVLLLAIDHKRARLFIDDDTGLKEIHGISSPRMRGGKFHSLRGNSPGRGEKKFHHVRLEETRRHFTRADEAVATALETYDAIGVVLCGEHRTVTEFQKALQPSVAKVVLGVIALNPKAVLNRQLREEAERVRHLDPR
jgi:hypothetical protein